MDRVMAVFQFELRSILSRRMFLIVTAGLPALGLLLVVFGMVISFFGGDENGDIAGYVDYWGRLPDELPIESGLRPFPDEDAARASLLADEVEAYFVIPADYVETGLVRYYTTSAGGIFTVANTNQAVLRDLLIQALVSGELETQLEQRVRSPIVVQSVRLTPQGDVAPEERDEFSRFVLPYVFAIMLMISILMSSGFLIQSVAEEKQTRTIEILLSSISPSTLMAGKILGLGAAGLLQIAIWLVSAWVLAMVAGTVLSLPTTISIDPVMVVVGVVFFLLGYFFFATILAAVGSLATSPQEGSQLGGFVTFLAVIPMFFIAAIIDNPGGLLARVFTFVPMTSPVTVMLRMSAVALPWLDIVISAVILALSGIGGIFLSARVFRTYLLLYGRRPSPREVWRTLRQAT